MYSLFCKGVVIVLLENTTCGITAKNDSFYLLFAYRTNQKQPAEAGCLRAI